MLALVLSIFFLCASPSDGGREVELGEEDRERAWGLGSRDAQAGAARRAWCLGDGEMAFIDNLPLPDQLLLAELVGLGVMPSSSTSGGGSSSSNSSQSARGDVARRMRCLPPGDAGVLQEALCELGHACRARPGGGGPLEHRGSTAEGDSFRDPAPPLPPPPPPPPAPKSCWSGPALHCKPHPEEEAVGIVLPSSWSREAFVPREGAPSWLNAFVTGLSPEARYIYEVYITSPEGVLVYR